MARKVKIGNISMKAPLVDGSLPYQSMAGEVIKQIDVRMEHVLQDNPDLVVLPENCDCPAGLAGKQQYLEAREEKALEYFKETARKNSVYIAYASVMQNSDGKWRNTARVIDRKGEVAGTYNKHYLTSKEYATISYGTDTPLIECDFGTVACVICFDLNFTELMFKYAELHPDIILFSSEFHGGLMQACWAYHTRAHFVGAVGGEFYGAEGTILSPVGSRIAATTNYFDYVTAALNLDCCVAHLDYNWTKFAAMKKKYGSGISIFDPGHLGSVLISSNMEEKNIKEIIKEFDIKLLDDYFNEVLKHRRENIKKQ